MINNDLKGIDCLVAKHKDLKIRERSRSGGVFTALSDEIIKQGGVVYGCAIDEKLNILHIRASSLIERDKMRGSKYVQSNLGNTFCDVAATLKRGQLVLFSGTPCQVSGLLNYLNAACINTENLITLDIICHGVASPKIIKDYIRYQEEVVGKKCTNIDFRYKKWGWDTHIEALFFGKKRVSSNIYSKLYYTDLILRPSCYKCRFKNLNHPADFSIADAWGIATAEPDFDDNKGVSLVLIRTKKAKKLFENATEVLNIRSVTNIKNYWQVTFEKNCDKPTNREEFWKYYKTHSRREVYSKYSTLDSQQKFRFLNIPKHYIKGVLKKLIKKKGVRHEII